MSAIYSAREREHNHFLVRALAILAAGSLVIASAGFGAHFAYSMNEHQSPMLAGFAVLMALGLEVAKPLAVHGVISSGRDGRLSEAAALFLLAAVAVGYSLTAELQLMARSRADAITERQQSSGNATDIRAKRDRLQSELDGISQARAVAELDPLISAKTAATKGADCNQWVADSKTRGTCLELAQLRAEHGRAVQRAELAAKIEAAETALGSAKAQKVGDPSAAALATYLQAFGLHVNQSSIGDWLTLVCVFALEVGSMFAAVLIQACPRNAAPNAPQSVPQSDAGAGVGQHCPKRWNAGTPAETHPSAHEALSDETPRSAVPPDPARITVPEHPAERLVALLREKGGEVFGSQRTLGSAIGISGAQLNRVLHDLAQTGHVSIAPGKSGTRVKLLAA